MTRDMRPCEEHREGLAMMTSGDLPDHELAKTMRHLSGCAGCRAHWKALQEDHRALQTFSRSLQGHVAELERNVIESVLEERRDVPRPLHWWRWIMATNTRRVLAVGAAAAVATILFLISHMVTAPFVAWAEVLENAGSATSCQFRTRNLDSPSVESVKVYSDLGFSISTFEDGELVEKMCLDFVEQTVVHMIPPIERGVSMKLGDEMLQRYLEQNPRHLFEHLAEIEHESLGSKMIDGRKLVGIRVVGRDLVPELMDEAELEVWADPETKWPFRIDVHGRSASGDIEKRVRFYDFKWNVPVDDMEFRPVPPSSYEMVSGIELEIDEKHALDALRDYARVAGGRYPSTLAYEQLTPEMWKILGSRMLSRKVLPIVHRIRAACGFSGKLIREGKDVVYFGDRVRPGDSERVLMRWRIGNDRYRVVFGDLRTENVDGASLLELEGK